MKISHVATTSKHLNMKRLTGKKWICQQFCAPKFQIPAPFFRTNFKNEKLRIIAWTNITEHKLLGIPISIEWTNKSWIYHHYCLSNFNFWIYPHKFKKQKTTHNRMNKFHRARILRNLDTSNMNSQIIDIPSIFVLQNFKFQPHFFSTKWKMKTYA